MAFYRCYSLTGVYFKGNAPILVNGLFVFNGDIHMTAYYLPESEGWNNFSNTIWPIAIKPIALWKPKVLTDDTNFGVRTNQFGFNISWASGMDVAVDACTDLANPVWAPLQTNSLTSDTLYFSDPQWTNYPNRFYRLRWP
jgi:hypothetical protein